MLNKLFVIIPRKLFQCHQEFRSDTVIWHNTLLYTCVCVCVCVCVCARVRTRVCMCEVIIGSYCICQENGRLLLTIANKVYTNPIPVVLE